MAEHGFVDLLYTGPEDPGARYRVFVPHQWDPGRKWPVILFLHGAGETGSDGVRPAKVGIGPAIARREKTFPYLTVFPQSQHGTWHVCSSDVLRAIAILDDVMTSYNGDPRRVHLTGISMGGFGTWAMAIEYPERWASIVPVCGGGDPGCVSRIRHIPCWAFHGDSDNVIHVEASRRMIAALRKAGGDPRYTEYRGVGHNSWDAAYNSPELYQWLAGNVRPGPPGAPLSLPDPRGRAPLNGI